MVAKKSMKILDAFLFSNELDLLEIRLNELDKYVDKFLLCEAKVSFAGHQKELIFEKNKSRYEKFLNKIIHLVVEYPPIKVKDKLFDPILSPEEREYCTRNFILKGIPEDFNGDDIILFSDVDEIPKLKNLNTEADLFVFRQDMYYFNFNTKFISPNDHKNWHGTIGFKAKHKKDADLQKLRFNRYGISPVIEDGGWHFSYFSDAKNVIKKIMNGGHSEMLNLELTEELINERINNQKDVLGRPGYDLIKIKDNKILPESVLCNKEKYKKFFI